VQEGLQEIKMDVILYLGSLESLEFQLKIGLAKSKNRDNFSSLFCRNYNMCIRMNAVTKINFKDVLKAKGNRSLIFTATFFLGKKSSQKSQDGRILSAHKASAGPVRRHSSPPRTN
jgi:hypothetical protein